MGLMVFFCVHDAVATCGQYLALSKAWSSWLVDRKALSHWHHQLWSTGVCVTPPPTTSNCFCSLQSRRNSDIQLHVVASFDSFVTVYDINFIVVFVCHP